GLYAGSEPPDDAAPQRSDGPLQRRLHVLHDPEEARGPRRHHEGVARGFPRRRLGAPGSDAGADPRRARVPEALSGEGRGVLEASPPRKFLRGFARGPKGDRRHSYFAITIVDGPGVGSKATDVNPASRSHAS